MIISKGKTRISKWLMENVMELLGDGLMIILAIILSYYLKIFML